ncbi:MAG: hypothetical protein ABIJ27_08260, partial [Candidatus Omnitrophota bacterium]
DILPAQIRKKDPVDYMLERTMMRPRDLILFFNQCIRTADKHPTITGEMIKTAEGEYSRLRLKSLYDEWNSDYPNLSKFVEILKNRSKVFLVSSISDEEIGEFCLRIVVQKVEKRDGLYFDALETAEAKLDPSEFRRKLFSVFYNIGMIGIKREPYEKPEWVASGRKGVSSTEISEKTKALIHPMFFRVLGVKE